MISFWEKNELLSYDLIVLGGGITGMFCALSYREKFPEASIAILERGLFSSGASTKNAGFACFGSLTELIEDIEQMNESEVYKIIQMRLEGLSLLRKTLGDNNLDIQFNGGYELFFDKNSEVIDKIDYVNSFLKPIFSKQVFKFNNSKINEFGFDSNKVKFIVENKLEGQINTGKMMRSLRGKVNMGNIDFFSNTTLEKFEIQNDQKLLTLNLKNEEFKLSCKKLAICNNAFVNQILPNLNIIPGRGLIIISKPMKNLKIKGSFHYEKGYYYFRNIDDRILLGGGRNMDMDVEKTTQFGINQKIKNKLLNDIHQFIIPKEEFNIEMEWSGIMAFGKNKIPIVRRENQYTAIGVKLGGMGIAIGSLIGKKVADLLIE